MRAGKKKIFYMRIGISKIFLQIREKFETILLFQIPSKCHGYQIPTNENVVSRLIGL